MKKKFACESKLYHLNLRLACSQNNCKTPLSLRDTSAINGRFWTKFKKKRFYIRINTVNRYLSRMTSKSL
jgi:hypothetical protein